MVSYIHEILARKGPGVVTVERSMTVFDTIAVMVARRAGSVLVVDGDTLLGIFTERDYMSRIVLQFRTSRTTAVGEVMTTRVHCVAPNNTVDEAMALMTTHRTRHLPVIDDGCLIGLVSIGDCVDCVTRDARARVESLERYISGSYPT